jgi:5-methylcytosine-specific restriction endonuclease McrA
VTTVHHYRLTHLTDCVLMNGLKSLISQDRTTTALLIAHLGEVDARHLYAPAGHPSMFNYCVEELHFSEEAAYKRIRVARMARQFPSIHGMLADGRLHLSAVVILASYLTPENAGELLAAATHKSKAAIERLLAGRFPQPDLPTRIEALSPKPTIGELSPGTVPSSSPVATNAVPTNPFPSPVTAMSKVAPLAPQRFALQCTVGEGTYEKLKYAQALLGHSVPAGELDQVLDRALDALIVKLEQQRFAKTDRPRTCRASENARHIPAGVKRTVWERDGGQCTFVGQNRHRCEARTRVEFDHVEPVANGGHSTVQGLQLRCRAHNQYTAEQAFGRDFMNARRKTGRRRALPEHALEVIPWLRHLGMPGDEARRWAESCEDMPDAPLEERLRHALKCSVRHQQGRVA